MTSSIDVCERLSRSAASSRSRRVSADSRKDVGAGGWAVAFIGISARRVARNALQSTEHARKRNRCESADAT
jgi:hypothetical protein